ncbi:uncharacterized protein LOC110710423 [Chenopodium quinoa]|uniref:uncharacterized protein LOC110710423 n=1 Tax=Chenopodium quinoa TaxID=63459 RepID=UPI000B78DE1B|nr:uncharacterized protein LOC110710423 [Chenopodium quinoa]
MGQNSGNPQGNQNNFKKQKYHHHNNNFNINNNFHGNNRQGGRNFDGGAKNSNQGNNKGPRHCYCKRCRNDHPVKDCEGGAQRNFQGSNNYARNKGVQQNGVKGNNNNGNSRVKSGALGKLNVISRHEVDTTKDVITDVIDVPIVIPTEGVVQCTKTFKDVPLEIKGKVFLSDLIECGLSDFDVILEMDWLSKYSAEIHCWSQKVQLSTVEGDLVTHWKHGEAMCPRIISMMKLAKYIKKGHPVYFCSVRNLEHEETAKPENIYVVNEFLDVFPKEIPGMPPKWAIDFTIELVLGTTPISKAPYRMAPAEISELKEQLQDLLEKGYIRPSASP